VLGDDATGTSGADQSSYSWQLRIRDAEGRVRGAGALLDQWHVLTCAHVVGETNPDADADPAANGSARWVPLDRVQVEFHRLADAAPVDAVVDRASWAPPRPDRRGDVAVLRLTRPVPDVAPARLSRTWKEHEPVRVFGFPYLLPEHGLWVRGLTIGRGGPGDELVQIDSLPGSSRVSRGFSGAAVLREADGVALGLVVAGLGDRASKPAAATLRGAPAPVVGAASDVAEAFREVRPQPDGFEVRFGVTLDGKLGGVIANAAAGVQFQVTLRWDRPQSAP
jgi:hypothetical protein